MVYALYRPHGSVAAGVVVIAAGAYEFTPLKRYFRRRCRDRVRSGLAFGLCCAGSSIGLMAMLVALGVMSVTWMSVIAVLVLGQKLLSAKAAVDVPLALRDGAGTAAGSFSRHRRFPAWCLRCEASSGGWAGASPSPRHTRSMSLTGEGMVSG